MQQNRTIQTSNFVMKAFLVSGAIAGPVFTVAWILEGATRANYDPLRQPISSLSNGNPGWTQTANFMVTGLLTLAFALGLWLRLSTHGDSKWGPLLIGIIAIGLLGAGVFVADPMNGFPRGTPDVPLKNSVTGRLHLLFSFFVFLGWPIACLAFNRLFTRRGLHSWANYSALTGIAFLVMFLVTIEGFAQVDGWMNHAGLFQRLTLTIGWAWLTLLAVHMLKPWGEAPNATSNRS
jgi:hypothetical protein